MSRRNRNISNAKRRQVFKSQSGICSMCSKKLQYGNFTIDHTIPISRGGSNRIENLQAMCYKCNYMKDSYSEEEFLKHIKRIYNFKIKEKEGDKLWVEKLEM